MNQSTLYNILFVCTGNICRSPTAEAVFRHKVAERDMQDIFVCDSAGTHGYHIGAAPDPRTQEAAIRRGVNMASLAARKVSTQDFHDFDLVVAMDRGHFANLKKIQPPKARAKLVLFLDYHPEYKGRDVPDPYYEPLKAFDDVYELIDSAADKMLDYLQSTLKQCLS
jgi:protein-tyrosine phosphatase